VRFTFAENEKHPGENGKSSGRWEVLVTLRLLPYLFENDELKKVVNDKTFLLS
jgi:hypothetical protein